MQIAPSTMRRVYEPLAPLGVGIDSLYPSNFGDGLGIDWEALRLPHLIGPYRSLEFWRADVLEKAHKRELGL